MNIGPIIFKEECSFIREIGPNERVSINMLKGEINADASRWVLHHELFNEAGEKSAHITLKGAWIDLEKRKLSSPPESLARAMHDLAEVEDYVYRKN